MRHADIAAATERAPAPAHGLGRRRWLAATAGALLLPQGVQASARGLVVPRAAPPDLWLTDHRGRESRLAALLRGRVGCVQLMFAGCTTTCPLQGAIFSALAREALPADVCLLSLTIDPLGDGPQQLERWLGRFGRDARWSAAAPRPQDVDRMAAFLRGAPAKTGTHTTQAFLFDRDARLAFRSVEMPTPQHLADLLRQLAAA